MSKSLFFALVAVSFIAAVVLASESADWAKDLFGEQLVKRDKSEVDSAEALKGKDKVAVYFSAHWCPPCRAFTPKLVKAYNEAREKGAKVELVFVSSDQTREKMYSYMEETNMDWLAIPYDGPRRKLGEKYGVRGIPTLIFLDSKGQIITKNGRAEVMQKGAAAFE